MNDFELNKIQAEYMNDKDAKEFSLGDVLDVKTSVLLAVIVFLAAESDQFFHATVPLSKWGIWLQYVSIGALTLAGIFAVLELKPRDYSTETSPEKEEKWVSEVQAVYAGETDSTLVVDQILKARYTRTKERVQENIAVNRQKSSLLSVCFTFTAIAFGANLLTLATRLF